MAEVMATSKETAVFGMIFLVCVVYVVIALRLARQSSAAIAKIDTDSATRRDAYNALFHSEYFKKFNEAPIACQCPPCEAARQPCRKSLDS